MRAAPEAEGAPLGIAAGNEFPIARLEHTFGRAKRIELLRALGDQLKGPAEELVLEVAVSDEYGHFPRLLVDPLRRGLRRLGVGVAEPRERIDQNGVRVVHFFCDADLEAELSEAGLSLVSRSGNRFVAKRAQHAQLGHSAVRLSVDSVVELLWVLPRIERVARMGSPNELFRFARALGRKASPKVDRAAHRHAIAWVDGLVPGAAGCYRRTALELATSPEAADEDVLLGLDVGSTGHAWLASDPRARSYDVHFRLTPSDAAVST